MIDPQYFVEAALEDSARVKLAMRAVAPQLVRTAARIATAFDDGRRLYACGNGGSASDAIHLVEEFVARYKLDRPGLPAHHLLDAATLTCWSNDFEFDGVFERQVEAMVRDGDVLVALSTSGNSPNVLRAIDAANARGAITVGLTGESGGLMLDRCTELIRVPSGETERIQEAHLVVIHLLCDLVERMLFDDLRDILPHTDPST